MSNRKKKLPLKFATKFFFAILKINFFLFLKNQSLKDYFIPAIHKYLPYLLIAIKESTSGFFAKSGLTWVDFYVASNIETINNLTPNELQQYPELVKHLHRVYALNELQDYLTHRKDTPI